MSFFESLVWSSVLWVWNAVYVALTWLAPLYPLWAYRWMKFCWKHTNPVDAFIFAGISVVAGCSLVAPVVLFWRNLSMDGWRVALLVAAFAEFKLFYLLSRYMAVRIRPRFEQEVLGELVHEP